jgi:hypothetical protein
VSQYVGLADVETVVAVTAVDTVVTDSPAKETAAVPTRTPIAPVNPVGPVSYTHLRAHETLS